VVIFNALLDNFAEAAINMAAKVTVSPEPPKAKA
jgi:hypothetical protein